MTVKEFLLKEKPNKYLICDRVRVPLSDDIIKCLDLDTIDIYQAEIKNDVVYIYTTFTPDSC